MKPCDVCGSEMVIGSDGESHHVSLRSEVRVEDETLVMHERESWLVCSVECVREAIVVEMEDYRADVDEAVELVD